MAFVSDEVRDQGLDYADTNGTRIDICSQEPTSYTEATSTYSLGNKTGLNTGATQDGATDGRRVVVPAIADGSLTGTGTATHWALTDGVSVLLATGALTGNLSAVSGQVFTLTAIDITIRDAT